MKKRLAVLSVWLVNASLKVLSLRARNKYLWVFGSLRGDSYNDNAKYLYEYVIDKLPHINAVWITRSQEVKKHLSSRGKKCYLSNEPEGRRTRLNAGYAFFTGSLEDFGKYDLCHGAVRVALWHGMPLKRLFYAQKQWAKENMSLYKGLIAKPKTKLYDRCQRDITLATSKQTKEYLIQSYEVKPETVLITGQPRNDALFDKNVTFSLKKKLKHPRGHRFVLYMPTWRKLRKHDPFLEGIILELKKDDGFTRELKNRKTKLYIKPHPLAYIDSTGGKEMVVLPSISDVDTQHLIAAADVLITDYSSVFIDYALLDRPIHFFVPDIKENDKYQKGLFLTYDEFAEFYFEGLETFKSVVLNEDKYNALGLKNTRNVNQIYNDPLLEKGSYCENVVKAIQKM